MGLGQRTSGQCIYLHGTRTKLCTSALRSYIEIKERKINTPKMGSYEPIETFTTVASLYAAIVPRASVSRFNGVNVREGTITHLFYVRYDEDILFMGRGTLFIDFQGYGATKVRRFRLINTKVLDEANEWMVIEAAERGDASLGATEC